MASKPKTIEQLRKDFVPVDVINHEKPIRNSMNYRLGQRFDDFEHPMGVSETVPDQSLSIIDILSRHKRGIPVRTHDPIYLDEEVPNLAKMDLTERQEVLTAAKKDVNNKRAALQKQASEAARRDAQPPASVTPSTGAEGTTPTTGEVPK